MTKVLPTTINYNTYILGCPPSQNASGKWRFSSGSRILKMFHNPGGHWHPVREATPKSYIFFILVAWKAWSFPANLPDLQTFRWMIEKTRNPTDAWGFYASDFENKRIPLSFYEKLAQKKNPSKLKGWIHQPLVHPWCEFLGAKLQDASSLKLQKCNFPFING